MVMEHKDEELMLTRLGLTSNEARIYLALFLTGLSTAKTISKKSEVARPEVYRILQTLEELGLAEKTISVPSKFRAISMKDAVSVLMERRIKETCELQAVTKEILKKFEKYTAKVTLDEDETKFILVPERVNTLLKRKTLGNVQRSYDVVASYRNPHGIIFVGIEEIAKALLRGVKVRVIINKPDKEEALLNIMKHLEKFPTFKTKYILDPPKALISIYDGKEAWVCTCTQPGMKECPTLWTDNPCLLSILQDFFDILWLTTIEKDKLGE
jgi:sugar-specific transcriptional regulator TrmB